MRELPTVLASSDGGIAVEVLEFEGRDGIPNRDATGYYFTVRLAPDEEPSRIAVLFSGTVFHIGPDHLGLPEVDDRDLRFQQYAMAAIGEHLDNEGMPDSTPSGIYAFAIECFSGQFQAWRDRTGASDEEVERYLRSHAYWSWKFDHRHVDIGGPDRLRLNQPMARLIKIAELNEGTEWTIESRDLYTMVLSPTNPFIRSFRDGEIDLTLDETKGGGVASPTADAGQGEPSALQFVDEVRIADLHRAASATYDLAKLISLCEELNVCYRSQCYHAVAALTRAIIDHVPPLLGCSRFAEVVNNYGGGRSFSDSMKRLEGVRKIADAHLHSQVRRTESLPTRVQVNFSAEVDVLLGEVVRALAESAKDSGP